MKELTKAEEQIMQILWKIEKGFVNDIIEKIPEPKPAYNTISTIVRILVKKKIVGYKSYGKSHQYYPLISEDEYKSVFFKGFMKNYFSNSFKGLVSYFSKEKDISIQDLEELKSLMDEEIEKRKK